MEGDRGVDDYQFSDDDLVEGTHDAIQDKGKNILSMSGDILAGLQINGEFLGDFGRQDSAKLPDALSGDTSIAFDRQLGAIVIDLDQNGEFNEFDDMQTELNGLNQVVFSGKTANLTLF